MCLVRSALNLSIKRNASQVQVHVKFILNSPLLFCVKVIVKLKGSWSLLRKSIFAFRCPLSALKFSASSNIIIEYFYTEFYFFRFLLAVFQLLTIDRRPVESQTITIRLYSLLYLHTQEAHDRKASDPSAKHADGRGGDWVCLRSFALASKSLAILSARSAIV